MKSIIINDDVHKRIKRIAKEQGKTLSSAVEKALIYYADRIEYSKTAFENFIDSLPNLSPFKDLIKSEFKLAPLGVCRSIIQMQKTCGGDIKFKAIVMPESKKALEEMFTKSLQTAYIILESPNSEIDKAQEEVKKLAEELKRLSDKVGTEVGTKFTIVLKINPALGADITRLLIFACYKKEETQKEDDLRT